MTITEHANKRKAQRGIPQSAIDTITSGQAFTIQGYREHTKYHIVPLLDRAGKWFTIGVEKDNQLVTLMRKRRRQMGTYLTYKGVDSNLVREAKRLRAMHHGQS